jgi:hypothetical protein
MGDGGAGSGTHAAGQTTRGDDGGEAAAAGGPASPHAAFAQGVAAETAAGDERQRAAEQVDGEDGGEDGGDELDVVGPAQRGSRRGGDDPQGMVEEWNKVLLAAYQAIKPDLLRQAQLWHSLTDRTVQVFNDTLTTRRARRARTAAAMARKRAAREQQTAEGGKTPPQPKKLKEPLEHLAAAGRDLVYNSDLRVRLNIPPEVLAKRAAEGYPDLDKVLQQELDKAAMVFGQNPSWSLADRRRMIQDMAQTLEEIVREGPDDFSIFRPYKPQRF